MGVGVGLVEVVNSSRVVDVDGEVATHDAQDDVVAQKDLPPDPLHLSNVAVLAHELPLLVPIPVLELVRVGIASEVILELVVDDSVADDVLLNVEEFAVPVVESVVEKT